MQDTLFNGRAYLDFDFSDFDFLSTYEGPKHDVIIVTNLSGIGNLPCLPKSVFSDFTLFVTTGFDGLIFAFVEFPGLSFFALIRFIAVDGNLEKQDQWTS